MTRTTTTTAGGSVYGIRLENAVEFRYVGLTTKPLILRLRQHLRVAGQGRKTPFYDWLRKQNRSCVTIVELATVEGLQQLGQSEIHLISSMKEQGHGLLNLSQGGLGPTGVVWTKEMREAARVRKGTNSASENPNFGKFGPEHPSYGYSMSEESRKALAEARMGPGNPNFGKKASAETRAKMSAVRKGRPMPSSQRSAHTRHHTNKGLEKADCKHCVEDSAKRSFSSESESES